MVRIQITRFQDIAFFPNLRLGFNLIQLSSKFKTMRIIDVLSYLEAGSRPKGGVTGIFEGAISLGGEQIGANGKVDLSNTPYVPMEFYSTVSKGHIRNNDILVCKDGALTGKTCYVDSPFPQNEVMVNEHVYIMRANTDYFLQKFLFYCVYSDIIQEQIKGLAYNKSGQPGLNQTHLKHIRIPLIPIKIQNKVICEIEKIEKEIEAVKTIIGSPSDVINEVIKKELGFNWESAVAANNKTSFVLKFSGIQKQNKNMRFGYGWNKICRIQKQLYKDLKDIKKLGYYIKETKNGWSPQCNENSKGVGVLGVDAISVTANILFDNLKYTAAKRKNITEFYISKGDFFTSRGNTVDLVALAGVVEEKPRQNTIFPDLFIRIKFDETEICAKYLAFIFNSLIGRLYFKYSAKGKNQTMVKISSTELENFYLPIPCYKRQEFIASEIQNSLDKQEIEKEKIFNKRNEVESIIEAALRG